MPGSAPTSSIAGSRGISPACPTTRAPRSASRSASRRCAGRIAGEHADAGTVPPVILAEETGKVALLVMNGDQHVDRKPDGEEQVAGGHKRRRPESDEEARIKRVRDPAIKK